MLLRALVCIALLGAPVRVPDFSLKDPKGTVITRASLDGRAGVLVVTTPTHSQAAAQNGWSAALDPLAWPSDGPFYGWVEDFSQSWFKGIAHEQMKEKYDPAPWFLLDEDGALRKALGVADDTTVVLVFDRAGVVQMTESGAPTAARAKAVWLKAWELSGRSPPALDGGSH